MGNQNSGRRPQPTALKVLRGNPGKRKPSEFEPVPMAGEVVKPEGLSRGASAVWDELAPVAIVMGTLTLADVRSFRTLCELEDTFSANTATKGTAVFDVRLERETAAALRPYYGMFGLEPASRTRIMVPKKKAEEPVSK